MKIEISHDALAKRLFERASTEDKMRLKVKTFIQERYKDFTDPSRRTLLRVSDLNYIEPYLKSLKADLSDDEHIFIRRSQNRKFWIRAMMIFAIFLVFAILVATLIQVNIAKNTFESLNASLRTVNVENETKNQKLAEGLKKQEELMAEVGIKSGDLTKTRDSLNKVSQQREQLIATLESKNKELEIEKNKLEIAKKELARANAQLAASNEKLTRDNRQLETTNFQFKNEKMNSQNAQKLSQKAEDFYKKGNKAEAFKAAAEAWQLDNNTPIAIDVLRKINTDITGAPNWSMPPQRIIEQHAPKFKFKLK